MEKVKISCKISFHEGKKFSRKHNVRDYDGWNKDGHINSDLTDRNIVLIDKDLKKFFEDEFADVIKKYNQKNQRKHPDRVTTVEKYFEENKKMARECIVQLGDEESYQTLCAAVGAEKANHTYEDYYRNVIEHWKRDNPNLKIFGAYIHFDETTPHLHLDYLPIGEYKRGMTKKVSRDGALSKYKRGDKYGENKWTQWATDERNQLETIAGNYVEKVIPHKEFNGRRTETYQWRQQAVDCYLSNPEQPTAPVKPEKKTFESKTAFEKRMQEYKQQKAEEKLWKSGEKIVVGRQDEREEVRQLQTQLQSECDKMKQTSLQLTDINQTLMKKESSLRQHDAQLKAAAQQIHQQAQQLANQMLQEQLQRDERHLQNLQHKADLIAILDSYLPKHSSSPLPEEKDSVNQQKGFDYE